MIIAAYALLVGPLLLVVYTYALYPALLWLLALRREPRSLTTTDMVLPSISITVPVYNEQHQIVPLLDSLLALDYPAELRQILIVSDASTDATDEIVASYAERGVELLRMPERGGKTAIENAARPHLRGDVIVNTDASIRIQPGAIRALVSHFADETVGVASGRDVSVALGEEGNAGEGGYVDFEMKIRRLETRVHGIVGASGCLYAIRRELHEQPVPPELSRDFSAALTAQKAGLRAVSVDEAVCHVPRVPSLQREYRRKVRTITRGLETLHHNRALLNPWRHGVFAWLLFSHKLCRWLVPWGIPVVLTGLMLLALAGSIPAAGMLVLCAAGALLAWVGWRWPEGSRAPRIVSIPAFLAIANVATLHAWIRSLRGEFDPVWEPTRRDVAPDYQSVA